MDTTIYLEQKYLAEEIRPLSEGLADTIKDFTIGKLKDLTSKIKKAAEQKDTNKLQTLSKLSPKVPIGDVERVASKKDSNYSQRKSSAEKALKKTKIPPKFRNHIAVFSALVSSDVGKAQKAVEYLGTSIDWESIGEYALTRFALSGIVLLANIGTGSFMPPIIVGLLAVNIFWLIFDMFTVKKEEYGVTDYD